MLHKICTKTAIGAIEIYPISKCTHVYSVPQLSVGLTTARPYQIMPHTLANFTHAIDSSINIVETFFSIPPPGADAICSIVIRVVRICGVAVHCYIKIVVIHIESIYILFVDIAKINKCIIYV